MSTNEEILAARALEASHADVNAHISAALWAIAAAGEFAVCDGRAYELQKKLLDLAREAQMTAEAMCETHEDLTGWDDVLDELNGDLTKFRAALVKPAQVEDEAGR